VFGLFGPTMVSVGVWNFMCFLGLGLSYKMNMEGLIERPISSSPIVNFNAMGDK
jgi:hypothetical protein